MILYTALLTTIDKVKDDQVLEEHKEYLKKHIEDGKIFAKGPFTDHSGGLVIYSVENIEEAQRIIENDPVIKHKSREYKLKEWKSNIE